MRRVGYTIVHAKDTCPEEEDYPAFIYDRYCVEYDFFTNGREWCIVEHCFINPDDWEGFHYYEGEDRSNGMLILNEITPDMMLTKNFSWANGLIPPFCTVKTLHMRNVIPLTVEEYMKAMRNNHEISIRKYKEASHD